MRLADLVPDDSAEETAPLGVKLCVCMVGQPHPTLRTPQDDSALSRPPITSLHISRPPLELAKPHLRLESRPRVDDETAGNLGDKSDSKPTASAQSQLANTLSVNPCQLLPTGSLLAE